MRQQQLEQALKHIEAIVDANTNQAVALLQIKGILNGINVKGNGLYSTANSWQQGASIRRAQTNGVAATQHVNSSTTNRGNADV